MVLLSCDLAKIRPATLRPPGPVGPSGQCMRAGPSNLSSHPPIQLRVVRQAARARGSNFAISTQVLQQQQQATSKQASKRLLAGAGFQVHQDRRTVSPPNLALPPPLSATAVPTAPVSTSERAWVWLRAPPHPESPLTRAGRSRARIPKIDFFEIQNNVFFDFKNLSYRHCFAVG